MHDPRRDQLLQWISRTRRTQRRFAIVITAMFAVSGGIFLWSIDVGLLAFLVTAITGICGYWITSSHIADWNRRLDDLAARGRGSRSRAASGSRNRVTGENETGRSM